MKRETVFLGSEARSRGSRFVPPLVAQRERAHALQLLGALQHVQRNTDEHAEKYQQRYLRKDGQLQVRNDVAELHDPDP